MREPKSNSLILFEIYENYTKITNKSSHTLFLCSHIRKPRSSKIVNELVVQPMSFIILEEQIDESKYYFKFEDFSTGEKND